MSYALGRGPGSSAILWPRPRLFRTPCAGESVVGGGRQPRRGGECPAATNSSSEYMLQVVAVDVLIDISTLRALVAIGSVKAELYFLDSVGSE